MEEFDRYFNYVPGLTRKKDFSDFWEKSLAGMKKYPLEPAFAENKKKSSRTFTAYDISYNGFMKYRVSGLLLIPQKVSKPRVIINVPDYLTANEFDEKMLPETDACLFLNLRGHDFVENQPPAKKNQAQQEIKTPGYMAENIFDLNTYYMKSVYLDVFRSIDMMRLENKIDTSACGIRGKGLGAAAAFFTAAYSGRVRALCIETPYFFDLTLTQNTSRAPAAAEINEFIGMHSGKKELVKSNLSYFDAINFHDRINIPVLATAAYKDEFSPAKSVFGIINMIKCDKTLEIYPDEGNTAGGTAQFVKSLAWLSEKINTA